MILSEAYKEIFKNENLTENLNNLKVELKEHDLVREVLNFIEKDKKETNMYSIFQIKIDWIVF